MDSDIWGSHLAAIASPELWGRLRYLEVTAKCHSREDMPALWVVRRCSPLHGRACGDSGRISCEAGARVDSVEQYLRSAEFERTLSLDGLRLDGG